MHTHIPHVTCVPSHPHLRLGRKARTHRKMLSFSDLAAERGQDLSQSVTFDYSVGLPADTGILHNDTLGCCTAAAKYHRLQAVVWKLTGKYLTPDQLADLALQFYEGSTGYNPADPTTDQGGNMQSIADYLINTGMKLPDGSTEKFLAAFEVDVAKVADLSYAGSICGGIDIGFAVTTSIMPTDGSAPPKIWDVAADDQVLGGHDVYVLGRLPTGNWLVDSWGALYQMTPGCWSKNVDEAYGYVSKDWMDSTGKTPLGMDVTAWEAAMKAHGASV